MGSNIEKYTKPIQKLGKEVKSDYFCYRIGESAVEKIQY